MQQEKDSLLELIQAKKQHIQNLEAEKAALQASIEALQCDNAKLKHNELLLLRYPDLYGPIEQAEELSVAEEMENQISANQHRITLLSNLNLKLGNSVRKLSEAQSRSASRAAQGGENEFMRSEGGKAEKKGSGESWVPAESRVPSRAYPLFKLESEMAAESGAGGSEKTAARDG